MNIKELAEKIDLEEDEYRELLELFIEEVSGIILGKLKIGLGMSDTQQVVEAAHSIKGSAACLGLEEIAEAAKGVEENARQNRLEGATEAATDIKERCDQIAEELTVK
jgi:HPt (histidine-containing phosphotransfer) domain-containing protein